MELSIVLYNSVIVGISGYIEWVFSATKKLMSPTVTWRKQPPARGFFSMRHSPGRRSENGTSSYSRGRSLLEICVPHLQTTNYLPVILREFLCEFSWYVYSIEICPKSVADISGIWKKGRPLTMTLCWKQSGRRPSTASVGDSKWLHRIWVSMKLKMDLDCSAQLSGFKPW